MTKGRRIGVGDNTADCFIELLAAVTRQAIQDAREDEYTYWGDALAYLNSETVRDLHGMLGVELPTGWNRKNVRHPRYRQYTRV